MYPQYEIDRILIPHKQCSSSRTDIIGCDVLVSIIENVLLVIPFVNYEIWQAINRSYKMTDPIIIKENLIRYSLDHVGELEHI